MAPTARVPNTLFPPGMELKGEKCAPTDHNPVVLSFSPPNLGAGCRFKIPEWIASLPILHERILKALGCCSGSGWRSDHKSRIPQAVREILDVKQLIKNESLKLMKELRLQTTTRTQSLTLGLNIFRGLRSGEHSQKEALSLASADRSLLQAVKTDLKGDLKLSQTQNHIKEILELIL